MVRGSSAVGPCRAPSVRDRTRLRAGGVDFRAQIRSDEDTPIARCGVSVPCRPGRHFPRTGLADSSGEHDGERPSPRRFHRRAGDSRPSRGAHAARLVSLVARTCSPCWRSCKSIGRPCRGSRRRASLPGRHHPRLAGQCAPRRPRRRAVVVLTRTTIEQAARHAASHPGIDAVILFGSRVRGNARPSSDWDLCVVGDRKPHDLHALLGLAGAAASPVNLLWRNRRELRNETREGSVWADIVRHGAVLAGDSGLLRRIRIAPMRNVDIQWALLAAVDAAAECAEASAVSPEAPREHAQLRAVKGTALSARAAEFLTRALLGLMGAQPGGGHDVSADAGILERPCPGAAAWTGARDHGRIDSHDQDDGYRNPRSPRGMVFARSRAE